ncbi:MAG: type II toxin-antitoxin system PemK/MazF family toxin [bacterium]|nr:type II toxin-antitoxin system PemK/MazF family toxin [bacterium]
MTSYELGEIVLIAFPQTGTTVKKKRPALVVLDIGDADLVLAPITSRRRSSPGDCRLRSWSKAGLLRPSWVRLAKVVCLEKSTITRQLGKLPAHEIRMLVERWNSLYPHSRGTERASTIAADQQTRHAE